MSVIVDTVVVDARRCACPVVFFLDRATWNGEKRIFAHEIPLVHVKTETLDYPARQKNLTVASNRLRVVEKFDT
jgi:hypothetical protein